MLYKHFLLRHFWARFINAKLNQNNMSPKQTIRKFALQNALRYNGKANPGALVGRVIAAHPEAKKDMKALMREINEIVKDVNKLGVQKQEQELKKIAPELLEIKPKEKPGLPPLKKAVKGKVVMRFEPSPSGPLHIGHAYVLGLNAAYCKEYGGKLILRIADTNPENIYDKAYDLIPEDAQWLVKVWKTVVQSDRIEIYYKYAEEVLKKGYAYVCTCPPEKWREGMLKSLPCPCRDISVKENLQRWQKMFKGYKAGDAVVRIKTSITHPNPAMRDWPALRINDSSHPRQKKKYRVWPLMNFSVAVDDHDLGITHAIRAKDHIDNEKRQRFLYEHMGWKNPEHLYVGRINFEDMEVSATKTRGAVEKKKFEGWDDIRLPFLPALRRRGYQPEAFLHYALDVGITQNDKTVSKKEFFKQIDHFNKEVIEPKAERYFFVADPVKITVAQAPRQSVTLDLHPDHKKGGRKFNTQKEFYVARWDYKGFKEKKLYRLMGCLNFTKQKNKFTFDSKEYEKYKEKGAAILHWLPVGEKLVNVEVRMPDNSIVKGLGEAVLSKLKEGTVIQLERFGFVRLDKKGKDKVVFWFAHR